MQRGFIAPLILLVVLFSLYIGGAYLYGKQQWSSSSGTESSRTAPLSETASTPTPTPTASFADSGIPIKPHTVSFARFEGVTYLRYKYTTYRGSDPNTYDDPDESNPLNQDKLNWYGLVDSPLTADIKDPKITDEVFSFKVTPKGDKFVFIMQWQSSTPNAASFSTTFNTFLYDPYKTNKVEKLLVTTWGDNKDPYPVQKIKQISPDGKYVAIDRHLCWGCDGGSPKINLINLETKQIKEIDQVAYFNWKEEGKYEYKKLEYEKCTRPSMTDDCPIDPSRLPLLQASF